MPGFTYFATHDELNHLEFKVKPNPHYVEKGLWQRVSAVRSV
jgi:hypothetical protein